jgi:hypothetical protein
MSDFDYKPNSHKYKEAQLNPANKEKRVEKVVSGSATIREKKGINKLASIFISDDVKNVKSYAIEDVLIPSIKKAVVDIIKNGAEMIFYGKSGRPRSMSDKISYNRFYDRDDRDRRRDDEPKSRSRFSYDDVIVPDRGEADAVLDRLCETVREYGAARITDLYDLVGITSDNYTDNDYGWTNLRNARVVRVRDGYAFDLPRALPLK